MNLSINNILQYIDDSVAYEPTCLVLFMPGFFSSCLTFRAIRYQQSHNKYLQNMVEESQIRVFKWCLYQSHIEGLLHYTSKFYQPADKISEEHRTGEQIYCSLHQVILTRGLQHLHKTIQWKIRPPDLTREEKCLVFDLHSPEQPFTARGNLATRSIIFYIN